MRVLLKTFGMQFLINIYIYIWGLRILPDKKIWRVGLISFICVEMLIYIIGYFGANLMPITWAHDIVWLCTSWTVLVGYMAPFLLIYELFRHLQKKKGYFSTMNLRGKKIQRIYVLMVFVGVVSLMIYGNQKFKNPEITEVDIKIEKTMSNIEQMKIAVVSDVHIGVLINKERLNDYVNRIMAEKPDLILLVGDIIDYDLASVRKQHLEEELKKLQAPYGVFAVTGNHEYIDCDKQPFDKINWLRDESGLTLIQDSVVMIDSLFYIVGREDDKCKTRKELPEIMKNVDLSYPVIVMNHEPHRIQEEVDASADIAVYGHTHNGQLFPVNLVVKMIYELGYGYKKINNTHLYTSSGLGLAGPQYRIGTKSEIVIMNVKFNK